LSGTIGEIVASIAASKPTDALEQRFAAGGSVIEGILRDENPVLLASSRDVAARLAARRTVQIHSLCVVGVPFEKICVALGVPCDREVRFAIGTSQQIEVRPAASGEWLPPCDAVLDFASESSGASSAAALSVRLEFCDDGNVRRKVPIEPALATPSPPISLRQLIEQLVGQEDYLASYRSQTLAELLEVEAALRYHCRMLKASAAARREMLSRQVARASASIDRSAFDGLRGEIADSISLLNKSIGDSLRRALGPEGRLQARITSEVSKVGEADLINEPGKKAIKLSVRGETQNELLGVIRELTKSEVGTAISTINAAIEQISATSLRALSGTAQGQARSIAMSVSGDGILERALEIVQVTVKYRGMLPKRGFFQRLAEGRKSIFAVLMFFSLFGSFLGFNWRSVRVLGVLFMFGFIASVIYTYRTWVEEDKERLEEELSKARDQLQMELRRVMGEVARELQNGFAELLDMQKKSMLSRLEECWRDISVRAQRESQELREAAQQAMKQMDARERQIQDLQALLLRAEPDFRAMRAQVSR
jgi:hypothetical protein